MNPGQKPEWIALAESDKPMTPRHITRGLPILAVAITAAIIGAGSIFAQPQELSVANAEPISVATTQSSTLVESTDSEESIDVSDTTPSAVNPSDDEADDEGLDDEGNDDNGVGDDGIDDESIDDEGIDD